MKKFVTCNHKGGVGKTSFVANISVLLARRGYRILVIDLDPQANLSLSLGVKESSFTVYEVMKGSQARPVTIEVGLDLIPSSLDLSAAELELASEMGREYIIKNKIEEFKASYDVVFIDTSPSIGLLALNALAAADYAIIPVQAQFLALQGITKLAEVLAKVQARVNPSLGIGGVLVTQYDARKVLDRSVLEGLEKTFGGKLFRSKIRNNVAVAEAPSQGKSIFDYAPTSNGAKDYEALGVEFIERFNL